MVFKFSDFGNTLLILTKFSPHYADDLHHRDILNFYNLKGTSPESKKVDSKNFKYEDGAHIFEKHVACNWNGFEIQPGIRYCNFKDDKFMIDIGIRSTWCYTSSFNYSISESHYYQDYPTPNYPLVETNYSETIVKPTIPIWILEPFFSVSRFDDEISHFYIRGQIQYRWQQTGSTLTGGNYENVFPLYISGCVGFNL